MSGRLETAVRSSSRVAGIVLAAVAVSVLSFAGVGRAPVPAVDCPPCDDSNPCTFDSCDTSSGTCRHDPNPFGACSDGNACTLNDECIGGTCYSGTTILRCDDGNICTLDSCNPSVGCVYAPVSGTACSDGDACTAGDMCAAGHCQPGAPVTCNDGNVCTDDSCSPVSGCQHVNNTSPCDDGSSCTVADMCHDGLCTGTGVCPCPDTDRDGYADCVTSSCDRTGLACGDCDDADAEVHPGVAEACNGVDDDCNGIVDDVPGATDSDADGVADACDNCPAAPNPDQNPCACAPCAPSDITISNDSGFGHGSGLVSWTTDIEHDIRGFNIVTIDNQGHGTQQNSVLILCQQCRTDLGASYSFLIPKHKSGRDIFVEQVYSDGSVRVFGPARKL